MFALQVSGDVHACSELSRDQFAFVREFWSFARRIPNRLYVYLGFCCLQFSTMGTDGHAVYPWRHVLHCDGLSLCFFGELGLGFFQVLCATARQRGTPRLHGEPTHLHALYLNICASIYLISICASMHLSLKLARTHSCIYWRISVLMHLCIFGFRQSLRS